MPTFLSGSYGIIYTPQLARYTALAAVALPNSELNTSIDVGWDRPVNEKILVAAFSSVLKKEIKTEPVIPAFVLKFVLPVVASFNENIKDMVEMIKWIDKGIYISRNPQRQKELFGELPTPEQSVREYCRDKGLI